MRAYIELARLSNAPTIISNVLVGWAIGASATDLRQPDGGSQRLGSEAWLTIGTMSLAILMLYVAGMALNDAIDGKFDRRERPERPIPSGRVSLQGAYTFVFLSMAGGVAIAAVFGAYAAMLAIALVMAIVLYDILHKRIVGAVVLMGVCRGLVYLTVAAAVTWPIDWAVAAPLSLALTLYIIFVTLIARSESNQLGASSMIVRLSVFLIAIALAPALWIVPNDWTLTVIAALGLIAWLVASQRYLIGKPVRVKDAVMAMLAGICLVDAFYLSILEQPILAVIAAACFVLTVMGHRQVSGT